VRGEKVIAYSRRFLDDAVPLDGASYTAVTGFLVEDGRLEVALADGAVTGLADQDQFVGYTGTPDSPTSILLINHGLHIEIEIDGDSPIGSTDPAGIKDVVLESAITTIVDFEDSVAAVDADDKVLGYRNWLGLNRGDLSESVTKGTTTFTRVLNDDRSYIAGDGSPFTLPGRSLLFVRNVGHLMTNDAIVDADGNEVSALVEDDGHTVSWRADGVGSLGWRTYRLVDGGAHSAWEPVEGVSIANEFHRLHVDPARGGLVISTEVREANYLWVPTTAESTLSRWDASTGRELSRYRVGLPAGECPGSCCWNDGCNMPSRVAIDGRGDAYVANRGFAMQGTVSKIAADVRDCVDRNGNGTIDTSTSSMALPWNTDECVLWTAPVGVVNAVLRAITIDRGDVAHPEGYPWVGGYNSQLFYRLNPSTGAVDRTVNVSPLHPYGGVVLSDGRLWLGTLSDGATGFFETTAAAPALTRVPYPTATRGGCLSTYGITADASSRLWFSGWDCRDALGLDTRSGNWTRVDTTGYGLTAGRGITVDATGRVWMALGGDGESSLVSWNADGFVPGGTINALALRRTTLPPGHRGPSGVGADRDGRLWVAHHDTSQLVRLDPATSVMTFTRSCCRPPGATFRPPVRASGVSKSDGCSPRPKA
jgi:streptogramin lyase